MKSYNSVCAAVGGYFFSAWCFMHVIEPYNAVWWMAEHDGCDYTITWHFFSMYLWHKFELLSSVKFL